MTLERRSALIAHPLLTPGTTLGPAMTERSGVILAERRPLSILQISAFASTIDAAAERLALATGLGLPAPNRFSGDDAISLRATGPGIWQLVGVPASMASAASLRTALKDAATVVDLSHARTAFRVGGHDAARALAKHCGLDLDAKIFPEGSATNTRFGHLGITLVRIHDGQRPVRDTRRNANDARQPRRDAKQLMQDEAWRLDGAPCFELLVFRGYAEFVFEAIVEAATEFGVRVDDIGENL